MQYNGKVNRKGWSTSTYVFNFDVTEKGLSIGDVYARFTDPWTGWFSMTGGLQNRPFGFEIPYSSSLRETPERGRMSQIIFPNERDLGMMLTIQGPKDSDWNWLKVDAGMFNGTGGPSAGANTSDFDKFKDCIGRLGIQKDGKPKMMRWGLGTSYYNGGFRIDTFNHYRFATDALGVKGFVIDQRKADVSPDLGSRRKARRSAIIKKTQKISFHA